MKTVIINVLCLTIFLPAGARENDSLMVMFWNLENFFDIFDSGSGDSDREFSPAGERRWTAGRYWRKCHSVAKTFLWLSDRYGRLPDVAGVAEVENRGVMQSVINGTALGKYDYVQVHRDSPDERGIDVALIYRKSRFGLLCGKSFSIQEDTDGIPMKTRDILYVCLQDRHGERYHFLVNHHPSKYGGWRMSAKKRSAVMEKMVFICDSLSAAGEGNIICMGDFNDTPVGDAFGLVGDSYVNLGMPLFRKGFGTVRYDGKWELIDMFVVSRDLADWMHMEICFPEFLSVRDNTHSGLKPLRTYTGPRYSGGVSDHLPIILLAD